jgi:hypothetical protein
MKENDMSYIQDIYIDDTALDVEWTEQAELAIKWGLLWSEAKDAATKAEEYVKIVRSELILKINKNPERYLGEGVKLTDPKVEAAYRTHPKHKRAKEKWMRAVKRVQDLEIAKNEISFTRKSALENLVTLHGQSYFAGPSVPRDLRKERRSREKTRKENNEGMRIGKRS